MKKLFLTVLLGLSFNTFAHCPIKLKEAQLCAQLTWIDGPYLGKISHFQISFWQKGDSSHTPVSPSFDVEIYSWMIMHNGHSHGGPKMTYEEISEGLFEVKDARFFMGGMKGHWEVRVDLSSEERLISTGKARVDFE